MKALEHIRPGPAEIIEIDRHMGEPSQKPKPSSEPKRQPEPPAPSQANRWVPITAIVCSIASVLIALGTYFHTVHRDNTAIQSVNSDEHTKLLIHDQLAPLQNKVEEMDGKLSEALGELKRMNEQVKTLKSRDHNLLAKSNNPSDILGSIRADLVKAEKQRQKLPLLKFAAYRKDVEALPPSTTDYWTTVAAIINYQSFLNQLENKAPDPSTVARPCLFVTAGGISNNNTLEGTSRFSRCIVDLDTTTNFVDSAVIRDSVVRYHGGAVTIRHAIFINCAFILDLKDFPQKPARPDLLRDLLASDQIYFTLPSAG